MKLLTYLIKTLIANPRHEELEQFLKDKFDVGVKSLDDLNDMAREVSEDYEDHEDEERGERAFFLAGNAPLAYVPGFEDSEPAVIYINATDSVMHSAVCEKLDEEEETFDLEEIFPIWGPEPNTIYVTEFNSALDYGTWGDEHFAFFSFEDAIKAGRMNMQAFDDEFVANLGGLEAAAIYDAKVMGRYKFTGTEQQWDELLAMWPSEMDREDLRREDLEERGYVFDEGVKTCCPPDEEEVP